MRGTGEASVYTAQTQRPTVCRRTGERVNSLIKCSLYVLTKMHFAVQLPVCSHVAGSLKSVCANKTKCSVIEPDLFLPPPLPSPFLLSILLIQINKSAEPET